MLANFSNLHYVFVDVHDMQQLWRNLCRLWAMQNSKPPELVVIQHDGDDSGIAIDDSKDGGGGGRDGSQSSMNKDAGVHISSSRTKASAAGNSGVNGRTKAYTAGSSGRASEVALGATLKTDANGSNSSIASSRDDGKGEHNSRSSDSSVTASPSSIDAAVFEAGVAIVDSDCGVPDKKKATAQVQPPYVCVYIFQLRLINYIVFVQAYKANLGSLSCRPSRLR